MATKKMTIDSDESASEVDSHNNFRKGDLGFGLGLKPGAVTVFPANPSVLSSDSCQLCRILSVSEEEENTHRTRRHSATQPDMGEKQHRHGPGTEDKQNENIDMIDKHCHKTFENSTGFLISGLRRLGLRSAVKRIIMNNESGERKNGEWIPKDQKDLFTQPEAATQEVTVLQNELEVARSHLDSKYRAIQILQSQALMINKETTRSILETGAMKKSLEQEVNCLQFDLSTTKECAMLSQQTWAERFDRVCLENETILATLRARSEQVRRTQLEKKALMRERDELLAMMDAKERLQYDVHRSSTNDAYLYNSMAQFAVLGACLCRGSKPEPCGCARAAARLKKENDLLKDEVNELKQNLEAATLKADSFLTAFDNQLDQNFLLGEQIRKICQDKQELWGRNQSKNRRKKGDHHQGWNVSRVSEHSNGQEQVNYTCQRDVTCRSVAVQVLEPLPDLISTLAEMLNDKTEALAHQRLVSKMLARKTQDLEKTMEQLHGYSKE